MKVFIFDCSWEQQIVEQESTYSTKVVAKRRVQADVRVIAPTLQIARQALKSHMEHRRLLIYTETSVSVQISIDRYGVLAVEEIPFDRVRHKHEVGSDDLLLAAQAGEMPKEVPPS